MLLRNSRKGDLKMVKTNSGVPWSGVLLGVSLLVACSSTPAPAPQPTPQATTAAPQPAPAPASSPAPSSGLASTQGEFPGITVAVQELKRGTNTLNLKFIITDQSGKGFATYYYLFEKEGHSVDGIHLIDPVGKKKYFVVRDSDGACLCSREIQAVAPGGQSVMWAKFPSPPDDVQKMTVEIPHFPPLEDVPVSR
jgi:hypothetical protein